MTELREQFGYAVDVQQSGDLSNAELAEGLLAARVHIPSGCHWLVNVAVHRLGALTQRQQAMGGVAVALATIAQTLRRAPVNTDTRQALAMTEDAFARLQAGTLAELSSAAPVAAPWNGEVP